MSKIRKYKGVIIYNNNGKWYCELFAFPEKHPFKTLKSIKNYITDYYDNKGN